MNKKEVLNDISPLYEKCISKWSGYIYGYRYKVIKGYILGPNILEVGCGTGVLSKYLSNEGIYNILSIDGAKDNIERAKEKCNNDNIIFKHCLFEEFKTLLRFNDIIIANSLEHIDNPVAVLIYLKQFLRKGGRMHITVPNAMSIHRQLGKVMGMLENEWDLNEYDKMVEHKRVYTSNLLRDHIESSGLKIIYKDGIMFKPISNSQMNILINLKGVDIVEGFYKLGRKFIDLSAEIYFCCQT